MEVEEAAKEKAREMTAAWEKKYAESRWELRDIRAKLERETGKCERMVMEIGRLKEEVVSEQKLRTNAELQIFNLRDKMGRFVAMGREDRKRLRDVDEELREEKIKVRKLEDAFSQLRRQE